MNTRPYELLARFAANGTIAGVSVRTITTVAGRDYEGDPQPLSGATDPAFSAFAEQFAASAVTERDAEKTAHETTKDALDTITKERDSLQTQVDAIPAMSQQIAELQAEIERLTALIPPELPARSIYPRELLGRLTRAEVIAALRSDDDDVIFAVANLQTTVSPVLMDSEETQMLIGSLVQAGILTPERMSEVLA
jgi:hypothetical protein